jgi:glutamate racemase
MSAPGLSPHEPIGIFDSGLGGLSVLREIQSVLPHHPYLYIADSAHVPYGDKSPEFIIERCLHLASGLWDRGCQAVVIACNTATAAAASTLRQHWPDRIIIGMEPAVKPAVAASKSGRIGILATVGTLRSATFAALLDRFAQHVQVTVQPAPGLVELVEKGDLHSPAARDLVTSFVTPLLAAQVDTIVLGCTHYPFLKDLIQAAAGPDITLIDTGSAVAQQLKRRLHESSDHPSSINPSPAIAHQFFSTGSLEQARHALPALGFAELPLATWPV